MLVIRSSNHLSEHRTQVFRRQGPLSVTLVPGSNLQATEEIYAQLPTKGLQDVGQIPAPMLGAEIDLN